MKHRAAMKAEQTNDDQEHPLPAMIYPRRNVFLMHEVDTRKWRKILSTAGGREGNHSQCIRSQVKVQPVATQLRSNQSWQGMSVRHVRRCSLTDLCQHDTLGANEPTEAGAIQCLAAERTGGKRQEQPCSDHFRHRWTTVSITAVQSECV